MAEEILVSEAVKKKGRKTVEKRFNTLQRLKIEYMSCDAIHPNAYNPNRQNEHDFELLTRSMAEDGFTQPIVCTIVDDEKSKDPAFAASKIGDIVIVDGEHRWRCAKALGYTEIPVVITDMTPAQMRISTLRHNRARGSEDIELTAQLLRDLETLGVLDHAQDSLMLDDIELQRFLTDFKASETLPGEEFSEAWEPDKNAYGDDVGAAGNTSTVGGDPNQVVLRTHKAVESLREREKKISVAKTEEERKMAMESVNLYRIHFMFNGDEADIMKQALDAPSPADRIVEIAKFWLAAHPEAVTVQ